MEDEEEQFYYIPTGSEQLDRILEGGIRSGGITEIFGASGSGKTQFCIEAITNSLFYHTEGNVIYASTKHALTPNQMNEKLSYYVNAINSKNENQLTVEKVLSRINYKRAMDLSDLIFSIYRIREMVDQAFGRHRSFRLVVIDSFTYFLRDQPPWERDRISFELFDVLKNIAVKFNCAVIITTDMSTDFNAKKKYKQLKPMLGAHFYQMMNQRIELQRNKDSDLVYAMVRKSISGFHGIARCRIDEIKGIIDI